MRFVTAFIGRESQQNLHAWTPSSVMVPLKGMYGQHAHLLIERTKTPASSIVGIVLSKNACWVAPYLRADNFGNLSVVTVISMGIILAGGSFPNMVRKAFLWRLRRSSFSFCVYHVGAPSFVARSMMSEVAL